ncbi:phosphoglucomutase/phosphomannomutase alpha/beta/alpha domain I [Ammonifex degensii KC4]|uniref:Phosphoglucomutase n=1 Tax=Ammonifex degensii (strain DSM 10501 / KC4) TaxID=429009 RepID=C9R9R7_AMMDK|nr:phosphoglucomutase/phosphomannomutase family protein [Ammonifex degensii]ACX53046.1 phosphoglucomutase/phosphomannomutase alpha/beta/alpha domain I [Ammonifex degensii KC4]
MRIKFGTDGWRGVIARDFTFANVERVAAAIAAYLNEKGQAARGVIVGFDNRFLADRFAEAVAEVLLQWGIPVYFPERSVPTPVVAFGIWHYRTGGAVVITASHNPPEYCGIKFIPEYAGPALPDVTERIESLIESSPSPPAGVKKALRHPFRPQEDYFAHLLRLVEGEKIARASLKVVVDPMFGAGIGYLEEILRRCGVSVVTIHDWRDPLFGGDLPDPVPSRLGELAAKVKETGAHLGLALDGDADRLGVITGEGHFVTPNQVLSLLCYHLLSYRGWRGPVARTVATTHLVDRIASAFGVETKETPVGFKYLGKLLREEGCLCAGEESGGLSVKGHVPEKDGILAGLLVVEMAAVHGGSLWRLWEEVKEKFGEVVSRRRDYRTSAEDKERILRLLAGWAESREELAGQKVVERITMDGVKFVLADGSWVLVRASGTEPVFRVYVEASTEEKVSHLHETLKAELGF